MSTRASCDAHTHRTSCAHRERDDVAVGAVRLQVRALQAEEVREDGVCQVRRPQAVLEAVVRRPGEHQVRQPQLLQVAQPLELRRVLCSGGSETVRQGAKRGAML